MLDRFLRINNDIKHFKIFEATKVEKAVRIKIKSEKKFKFEAA